MRFKNITDCSCVSTIHVLQSVMECYPPSEKRLKLESLVSRVVSPYLGHRGLYEGGSPKPVVPSRELDVAHLRRPSGKWKQILNVTIYQYVWLRTSAKATVCLWNSATPLNMSSKVQWDLFQTRFGWEDSDSPPIRSGRHTTHTHWRYGFAVWKTQSINMRGNIPIT